VPTSEIATAPADFLQLIGQPQNLISCHLAKLRAAHLVHARRGVADRRDTHEATDLGKVREGLNTAGAALHPALQWHPAQKCTRNTARSNVLFLSTGNSARSQMVQVLIKVRSAGKVRALSAPKKTPAAKPQAHRPGE
jgi:hypothetical protein